MHRRTSLTIFRILDAKPYYWIDTTYCASRRSFQRAHTHTQRSRIISGTLHPTDNLGLESRRCSLKDSSPKDGSRRRCRNGTPCSYHSNLLRRIRRDYPSSSLRQRASHCSGQSHQRASCTRSLTASFSLCTSRDYPLYPSDLTPKDTHRGPSESFIVAWSIHSRFVKKLLSLVKDIVFGSKRIHSLLNFSWLTQTTHKQNSHDNKIQYFYQWNAWQCIICAVYANRRFLCVC